MGNTYDLAFTANEAVSEHLGASFVTGNESKVEVADAAAVPQGIFQHDAAADDHVTVRMAGPSKAIAGAAFDEGVDLKFDANGKVIAAGTPAFPLTAKEEIIGRSLQAATAADEIVDIFIEKSARYV